MDIAHKQRLVGGLVLLALGLILVPAILDFSQDKPDPMQSAKIPDAPETKDMEVLPLEVWSEPINPKVDNSEAIVEKPEAAPPAKQTPPPSKQTRAKTADGQSQIRTQARSIHQGGHSVRCQRLGGTGSQLFRSAQGLHAA
jgi:cell division septation protein DedD